MTQAYDAIANPWKLKPAILELMKLVKKFKFQGGGNEFDRCMRFWVDPSDFTKFTPNKHNRLLKALRDHYGGIVLIRYQPTRKLTYNERNPSKVRIDY